MPVYCVDTHALIWYFTAKKTLSAKVKKILFEVFTDKQLLVIPTLVILELFHKNLKKKMLNFQKFLRILRRQNIRFAPFDYKILKVCYRLPQNINIHDRVIAATALAYTCPLITKDPILQKLPGLKTVW